MALIFLYCVCLCVCAVCAFTVSLEVVSGKRSQKCPSEARSALLLVAFSVSNLTSSLFISPSYFFRMYFLGEWAEPRGGVTGWLVGLCCSALFLSDLRRKTESSLLVLVVVWLLINVTDVKVHKGTKTGWKALQGCLFPEECEPRKRKSTRTSL